MRTTSINPVVDDAYTYLNTILVQTTITLSKVLIPWKVKNIMQTVNRRLFSPPGAGSRWSPKINDNFYILRRSVKIIR